MFIAHFFSKHSQVSFISNEPQKVDSTDVTVPPIGKETKAQVRDVPTFTQQVTGPAETRTQVSRGQVFSDFRVTKTHGIFVPCVSLASNPEVLTQ